MARLVFDNGYLMVKIRHLMKKRDGSFYYQRRVPEGLQSYHNGRKFIRESLQTKSEIVAAKKVTRLAAQHDALWKSLKSAQSAELTTKETRDAAEAILKSLNLKPGDGRSDDDYWNVMIEEYFDRRYGKDWLDVRYGEPFRKEELDAFNTPAEQEMVRLLFEDPKENRRVFLSDALERYLREHAKGQEQKFRDDAKRAIDHVITTIGDLPLTDYVREHASTVRDHLLNRGNKPPTVRRRMNSIVAVFNTGLNEFDLSNHRNPFAKLKIRGDTTDVTPREPFTLDELKLIAKHCHERDDELRHIAALQMDTGARLEEIVGLRLEDVFLDEKLPHIRIKENPKLGRTLKNSQSSRNVPLVGEALWGARRAMQARRKGEGGWLFPRYASDEEIKSETASGSTNKWLRSLPGINKTTHSFRHAMRDRLRDAEVPEPIQDAIGGWGSRSVGQGYGKGYELRLLTGHLEKVVFSVG